jgi:hypothetical protein
VALPKTTLVIDIIIMNHGHHNYEQWSSSFLAKAILHHESKPSSSKAISSKSRAMVIISLAMALFIMVSGQPFSLSIMMIIIISQDQHHHHQPLSS